MRAITVAMLWWLVSCGQQRGEAVGTGSESSNASSSGALLPAAAAGPQRGPNGSPRVDNPAYCAGFDVAALQRASGRADLRLKLSYARPDMEYSVCGFEVVDPTASPGITDVEVTVYAAKDDLAMEDKDPNYGLVYEPLSGVGVEARIAGGEPGVAIQLRIGERRVVVLIGGLHTPPDQLRARAIAIANAVLAAMK